MSEKSVADKLDQEIEKLLANPDSSPQSRDENTAGLLVVASDLRAMPDPAFKAHLKAELEEAAHGTGTTQAKKEIGWRVVATGKGATPPEILPTLFGAGYGLYPVHRGSFLVSIAAHAVGLAILLSAGMWVVEHREKIALVSTTLISEPSPYILPASPKEAGGGGGGGDADKLRASKGVPPKFAREQLAPPAVIVRNENPKFPVEPTVVGPPSITFPQGQLGDLSGVLGPPSSGTGTGGGIGDGSGGGVGSGRGPGVGPGTGGGIGGGVYRVGGGVSAPRPIYDPDPEYSEEARKAKYQGTVVLQVVVSAEGRPTNIHVMRTLGLGLDEKAIEAVRQWRFEPGKKDGRAVATLVNIEVNFRLY